MEKLGGEIMEIATLIFTIIGAIGGLGSFGCFLISIKDIQKVARSLSDETIFGREAIERFNQIKDKISDAQHWGPIPWEGEKNIQNMLEIKHISYDPNTMGIEWKDCKQSVRRLYIDDNEEAMIEGWRLK